MRVREEKGGSVIASEVPEESHPRCAAVEPARATSCASPGWSRSRTPPRRRATSRSSAATSWTRRSSRCSSTPSRAGNEIQLTDALQELATSGLGGGVHGVVFRGRRYDTGDRLDYLKAVVKLGIGPPRSSARTSARGSTSSRRSAIRPWRTGDRWMIPVEQHLAGSSRRSGRCSRSTSLLDAQGCVLQRTSGPAAAAGVHQLRDGRVCRTRPTWPRARSRPWCSVVNDIAAGNQRASLATGQTMRIMTGAPMPRGADAVVLVEQTDGGVVHVSVQAAPEPGQHVRAAGEDVLEGQIILRLDLLGPGQIALLAAAGLARSASPGRGWSCCRPATSSSSGAARVRADRRLELRHAHRRRAGRGCHLYRVGGVPDDARQLMETLEARSARADAIITTGGVSMGAFDTARKVLSRVGTTQFDKVAMRPGMPQGFGVLGEERVRSSRFRGTRSARWCRSTSSSPRRCGPWLGVPRRRGRRATCRRRPPSPGSRCPGRWSSRGSSSTATGSGSRVGRVAHARRPGRGRRAGGHSPGGHSAAEGDQLDGLLASAEAP